MKSVPCSLLASGSFFKSRKVMDWKDDLLDGKKWNKSFKTGQVFAFQIRNWNKLLNSPHISPGNALLYCNFVVLMIFTEKLIYWIKKFFKFAVLEHDHVSEPRFQILLAFCWQTDFLESFLVWVRFLTPLPAWCCVQKFSSPFSFARGKASEHRQRANYKISDIKIEGWEKYSEQGKNKKEDFTAEFCAAGLDSRSNPTMNHSQAIIPWFKSSMSTWVVRKRWFTLPFSSPGIFCCCQQQFSFMKSFEAAEKQLRWLCPAPSPPPNPAFPLELNCYYCPARGFTHPAQRICELPTHVIDPGEYSLLEMSCLVQDNLLFVAFLEVTRNQLCEVAVAFLAFPHGWDIVIPLMLFLTGAGLWCIRGVQGEFDIK